MFGKMFKSIKKFFRSNVEMCYKDPTRECPSRVIVVGASLCRVGATQCCKHRDQWSDWAKVRHDVMNKK